MINILFVDDEPNILDGLKRMLRPLRHEWNTMFATSGDGALATLEDHHVDVIVSDMKMPGMDGAELLTAVTEKYPHAIRIVLSGYSAKEMTIRSVGTAHQYLSKPCDAETLQSTIKRASALRNLLTNEPLRRLVSQLPKVPSLPSLYTDLVDELAKAEPSTRVVAEIVKKDIGMTVKLLQIVNSAFFGLRRHVSDSRDAVEFLGLDTISSLTLGLGIISQMDAKAGGTPLAKIWAHSMSVAAIAQKIAICEDRKVANDAFTAGLLHDLGQVVLAANLPDKFKLIEGTMAEKQLTRPEAEALIFNATHSEVGAFLIGLWGLPASVVQAVGFHDSPRQIETSGFTALTAVHAANAFQRWVEAGRPDGQPEGLDLDYLADLGLIDRVPVWQEKCAVLLEDGR